MADQPAPAAPPAASDAYRVLIVDDSVFIRGMIARALQADTGFRVVGTAANGQLAIEQLKKAPADIVILDIEMPVMDGLAAIEHLKKIDPGVQIIMASTLTERNADISLRALSLGAADYLPKPSAAREAGTSAAVEDFNRQLLEKARSYGAIARRSGVRRAATASTAAISAPVAKPPPKPFTLRHAPLRKPDIIAIGSSTGGPQALMKVIAKMGAGLPQPVVITQHIPPFFSASLAKSIAQSCQVTCAEGAEGMAVQPGHYYLAPGDQHMLIRRKTEGLVLKLVKDPPENYCRPSVDPMLRSVIEIYGRRALAVILTGMGQDGKQGCAQLVAAGGGVIAQDEVSSVVWGMPGAVAEAGLCSAVLPLDDIGARVRQIAQGIAL